MNDITVTEPADVVSPAALAQSAIENIPKSIWQLTEEALELLRSQSRAAVHAQKKPGLYWLDELTETQGNTVIAVRQLCDETPEGITLKKLAEVMGVSPAATSVMVDVLVRKKMLRRTRSKGDRREILIRLTPDVSGLFDISEQTLYQTLMSLQESIGPQFLLDWQAILMTATAALQQVVAGRKGAEETASESSPAGDDQ